MQDRSIVTILNTFSVITFLLVPMLWLVSVALEPSFYSFGILFGSESAGNSVLTLISFFFLVRVLVESSKRKKKIKIFPLLITVYGPLIIVLLVKFIHFK